MKKITAFLLTFIMVIAASAILPVTSAEIINTEEYLPLEAFGILEEGQINSIDLQAEVTKGEFTELVAALMGDEISTAGMESANIFFDVPENHKNAAAINTMYKFGYVYGNGNGSFTPGAGMKFEYMVRILLDIMGYKDLIAAKDGSIDAYMAQAASIGLLSNIDKSNSWLNVLKLIMQAIEAPVCYKTSFGEQIKFEIDNDRSLLYDKLGIKYGKNIVMAADERTLSPNIKLLSEQVQIGNKVLVASDSNISSYLGYEVKYYYKERVKEDFDELVTFVLLKNTVKKLDIDEVISFVGNTIRFYDAELDKDVKENVSSELNICYNGMGDNDTTNTSWLEMPGYVTLIDNRDDGVIDSLIVNAFEETYVVSGVSVDNMIIMDVYGNMIDLSDTDKLHILKNGEEVGIEELKKHDVAMVAASRDRSLMSIEISNDVWTGTVTGITDEGYVIDGAVYQASAYYTENESGASSYAKPIRIGDNGIFYIDITGRFAAVTFGESADFKFGYMIAMAPTEGMGSEGEMKIFASNGQSIIYNIASNVTLDYRNTKEQAVLGNAALSEPQLVKFKVNGNGEVSELLTSAGGIDRDFDRAARIWRPTGRCFDGIFGVDDSTLIIEVPYEDEYRLDEEMYSVKKRTQLPNDVNLITEAFNVNQYGIAGVVVVYTTGSSDSITGDTRHALVTKIQLADNEGKETYQVEMFFQGVKTTYYTYDKNVFDNALFRNDDIYEPQYAIGVDEGDVIKFITNAKDEITYVLKMFDYSEPSPCGPLPEVNETFNNKYTTFYGRIKAFGDGYMTYESNDGTVTWTSYPQSWTSFTVYNTSTGKAKVIKAADAMLAANNSKYKMFTDLSYTALRDVILYYTE